MISINIQVLLFNLFKFILSWKGILLFLIFILFLEFIMFIFRDLKYIKNLEKFKHKTDYDLEDLKEIPLINFIIPAWKEEKYLEGCISSILKLNYPKKKIIINAGGNQETINIANSFKIEPYVKVIYQEQGKGKIKAINDCLPYIEKGIIYLLDADVYLSDENFFRMIFHLINENEYVTVSALKPHKSIEEIDLVKYLYIIRNPKFRFKFKRYFERIGPNTAFRFEPIKKVGKFSEGELMDDGSVIGKDLKKFGYKVYAIIDPKVDTYNFLPSIREYITQNLRWMENRLFNSSKKIKLKFLILVIISLYIIISPFLVFINFYLFIYGILLFFGFYLKKIRKVVFYYLHLDQSTNYNLNLIFYFKIIFYMYIEFLMNIVVFFEMVFFRKNYKKRKNLL